MRKLKFGACIFAQQPLPEVVRIAQLAEELGYDSLWIADSQVLCRELYVTLTACALGTSRIKLGAGVTAPYTRHVSVTASAFASLNELAPGQGHSGCEHGQQPGQDHRAEAGTHCGDGGVRREADGPAGQPGHGLRWWGERRHLLAGQPDPDPDIRRRDGAEDAESGDKDDIEHHSDGWVGAGFLCRRDWTRLTRGWGRRGRIFRRLR